MIKASSLFYTLIITLLIAIVSSSLILYAYFTRLQFQDFEINQKLNRNAESGLSLLLSKQDLIEVNQQKTIDLFNNGDDNVELILKSWGAYEIAISKAEFKNKKSIRIAQVGFYPDSMHLYSIYIPDYDEPIALCGKTIIKGTAFLPKAGVKRAYIEGQSFVGKDLINGAIKQSDATLPEFNKSLIKLLEGVFEKQSFSDDDSVLTIEKLVKDDTLNNSFLNNTLLVKSAQTINILGGDYSGNIVFVSSKQIKVSSDASMKDVILFAPKIIIENNFKGTLQAYASDSIIVNNNAKLYYPSVLGLVQGKDSVKVGAIILNKDVVVRGNVFVNRNENNILKQAGIVIKEGAEVKGQLYSNGFADVKGIINGSLMCNRIMLVTPSSVYENHLLNAIIDVTKLSKHFVGINLVQESKVKKVVKWLN